MSIIYILNENETVGDNTWGGNFPLSNMGELQTKALKSFKCFKDITEVYISTSLASKQTADILFPKAKRIENRIFNDFNYGDIEKQSKKEEDIKAWDEDGELFLKKHHSRDDFADSLAAFDLFINSVARQAEDNNTNAPVVIITPENKLKAWLKWKTGNAPDVMFGIGLFIPKTESLLATSFF